MRIVSINGPMPTKGMTLYQKEDIHVFAQYFVHRDSIRRKEISDCLIRNCENPLVFKVHLLNEREYSPNELGLLSPKIEQTVIGHRLTFRDVFKYIQMNQETIKGYLVICNIDMFLDHTLQNLFISTLDKQRFCMAQLRYEYRNETDLKQCNIFGPRFCSQDTWIFHSNQIMTPELVSQAFSFEFGMPGCDNKLIYLLMVLGFTVYNDPVFIRTYHNHSSIVRDYTNKDIVKDPYGFICPYGVDPYLLPSSLGVNMQNIKNSNQQLSFQDNSVLYNYILRKGRDKYIVPRVAGIGNNVAIFAQLKALQPRIAQIVPAMKNNAGILLTSNESVAKYSSMYLKAFQNCEIYTGWNVQGTYIDHIAESQHILKNSLNELPSTHQMIWNAALDIFHYISGGQTPWTWALRGKRILIVSPFKETINEQLGVRDKIWGDTGIDLFPECSFIMIQPPMTQAQEDSREFDVELDEFYARLDLVKGLYDVALVSGGGYGNLICNYIYGNHNQSAIYVGGVLQMYFGILGNRWLQERSDILLMYMNQYWQRPKPIERPKGFGNVENACYW